MNTHKNEVELGSLSLRQLRARRRRLVAALPDVGDYLAGSLVYVPEALAPLVGERVALTASVRVLLADISAINLELLARRKLE